MLYGVCFFCYVFFSSRRRHTSCALVTGVQTCALPICVIQIGLAMQSYNAIRSVTAETARFALVQYQQGNEPTNAQIRAQALGIADGPPYLLDPNDLTVTVNDAVVQRVNGAKELTVSEIGRAHV